jgi:diadenosine tetraphosphate (Ap4A) HIT family hydrolase
MDRHTYVIVPRESHVKHHLLVVLKASRGVHKDGLIHCTADDLKHLGAMISRWCNILEQCGYDRVYTGCYSDEGHAHFHLIPFQWARDKGYNGRAMQWLGEKEWRSDNRSFDGLSDQDKRARFSEIECLVATLTALHRAEKRRGG